MTIKKELIQETHVSIKGQFTQADIPDLLEKIRKQISELKGNQEKNTRITAELSNGFGKISDIKDPNTLREAYAYITHKHEAVTKFDEVFKAVAPTTKLAVIKDCGGATVKQIQEEILLQYREITFKDQLDKLEKTKTILEDSLSEDMKLQAKLANIAELLEI